jgi:hypothetical protein
MRFYLDNAGFAPPKISQKSCAELLVRVMVEARSADVARRCAESVVHGKCRNSLKVGGHLVAFAYADLHSIASSLLIGSCHDSSSKFNCFSRCARGLLRIQCPRG